MANLYTQVNQKLKEERHPWTEVRFILTRIGDDWISHSNVEAFTHCAFYTNYEPENIPKARVYGTRWIADVL